MTDNSSNRTEPVSNPQRVCQAVGQIPKGKVASYGQIATLAGLPGAARLVGNVLRKLPDGSRLPWHRVINSQGKISLPIDSPSYQEQKKRLLAEGIDIQGSRIALKTFGWQP
jgi:methylated-DNA-protein-cysteine methyltransferase-like protein